MPVNMPVNMPSLYLLGQPYAEVDGVPVDIPPTKPAYLLLHLAYRSDWATREELATLFRPEVDEARARQHLRLLITRARKFSWAEDLEVTPQRLRWQTNSDVARFRAALGSAAWAEADALYRGELLAGLNAADLPGYAGWLDLERSALRGAWREALQKRAADAEAAGDYAGAAVQLKRLVEDEPLAEDVVQSYLKLSYLAGQRDEALRAFESFQALLAKDLGLEPLGETLALAETIRRAEPLAAQPRRAARVPLSVLRPPVLVGRAEASAAVLGAEVQSGGARVTLVTGEPGVGKTRLLQEVVPEALWLSCYEGLERVPYFPVTELLRARAAEPPFKRAFAQHRAELARLTPELFPHVSPSEGPPDTAKTRLLEALASVLEFTHDAFVVDDLQWADPATLELVVVLAARGQVRLYGTYRRDEVSAALSETLSSLKGNGWLHVHALSPLAPEDIRELLAHLGASAQGPERFSRWLFERSGGNPFFALETLKALFESDLLVAGEESWYSQLDALSRSYDDLSVPASVSDVIARRVARLSEETRRVLNAAAVLHEELSAERLSTTLSAVVGLSPWAVAQALAEAEAKELLNERGFTHDLLRQTLYRSLAPSQRRFLHLRIAEVLADTDPLVTAEHYAQAGQLDKAAELWFNVARFRFSEGNFEAEAALLFERVAALNLDTPSFYRAQAYLAGHYHGLNRRDEMNELIENVLRRSSDPLARTFALLQKTTDLFIRGQMGEAEQTLALAERQITEFDDPGIQRDVFLARVYLDQYAGNSEAALELAERVLADKRTEPPDFGLISWLSTVALVRCTLGQFEAALELYYEQLEMARDLRFVRNEVQAASDILATLYDLGRVVEGVELGERALALGEFDVTFPLRYSLALAYLEQRRYADALEQTRAIFAGDSSLNIRSHTYALLAELYTQQGESDKAHEALNAGLDLVESADHKEAQAVVVIAALNVGTAEHAERVRPLAAQLSAEPLPAYIQKDFDEALALRRSGAESTPE